MSQLSRHSPDLLDSPGSSPGHIIDWDDAASLDQRFSDTYTPSPGHVGNHGNQIDDYIHEEVEIGNVNYDQPSDIIELRAESSNDMEFGGENSNDSELRAESSNDIEYRGESSNDSELRAESSNDIEYRGENSNDSEHRAGRSNNIELTVESSNDSDRTVNYESDTNTQWPQGVASTVVVVSDNSNSVNMNTEDNSDRERNELNREGINLNRGETDSNVTESDSNRTEIDSNRTENDPNGEGNVPNREGNPQVRKLEPHTEEPPAKMRKISEGDEQDGESCPICLEPWGNSGDHRLIALKCGHLFGSKCVERWLKAQPAKDRSCPTCKSKAMLRDIRFIYARKLVAADTSEITNLQKQVERLQSDKIRVEMELQKTKIAHRASIQQLEALRSSLAKIPDKIDRKHWRFALEKNLEICKDGGCRVLSYNCRTYELYVSQKSTNNLFPGFGVRKVSCVDYKLNQFIYLHPKAIRDITYSQPMDLLLSVSLDSTARIVERGIANLTVQTKSPLWSCCWDLLRHQEFFVGGVGGVISNYDVRNTSSPLHRLQAPSDMSPVVSVCSTEFGLLSCSLNSSWLWVPNDSGAFEPRALPVEGPFMSLSYDSASHRAIVSCRSNGSERSKLSVCKLSGLSSGETICEVVQTFNGSAKSSLMSRAAWVQAANSTWVGAHSESDSALFLYGLDGARTMSLPAAEPALDVACVDLNGDVLLAALSDSRLRIYKGVTSS